MAETTIDSLQIEINAKAQKANDAIDTLVDKLDILSNSLSKLDGAKLASFANGVNQLGVSVRSVASIDGRTFTALANNISKIANINSANLMSSAYSVSSVAQAFNNLGAIADGANNIGVLANSIRKLGGKNVQVAITNLPALAQALKQVMSVLATSPKVSLNIIRMTNALASLASQGAKVKSASHMMANGLERTNSVAKRTAISTFSLARAFGKFYANYFLLVRGFKGLFKSMETAMDLTETVNYFEVTLDKIGKNAIENWDGVGADSADAYTQSFINILRENTEKLTGLTVSETGKIGESIYAGLGLSPTMVTQYSAMFAQVANSIGMTEEASVQLSEAFVRLGADWASLRNVDFKTAYEKLASGLSGQSRALRAFGVDITMATLQEIAFANGIEKSVSEMTQSEKAYLRLIAILKQSEVAWGDLSNTLDQPANQMRVLKQNIEVVSTLLGQVFMPVLQKILPIINGFTIALRKMLIALLETMGVNTENINNKLGGMDETFEGIADGVDEATESAEKFNKATRGWDELNILTSQNTKGYGVGNDIVENEELLKAYDDAIKEYQKAWDDAYAQINNKAEEFANAILEKLKFFDKEDLYTGAENFGEKVAGLLNSTITVENFEKVGDTLSTVIEALIISVVSLEKDFDFKQAGEALASGINKIVANVDFSKMAEAEETLLDGALELVKGAFSKLDLKKVGAFVIDSATFAIAGIKLKTTGNPIGNLFLKALEKVMPEGVSLRNLRIRVTNFVIDAIEAIKKTGSELKVQIEEWFNENLANGNFSIQSIAGILFDKLFKFEDTKKIVEFASNLFSDVDNAFQEKDWMRFGSDIVKGVLAGLATPLVAVTEPIRDLFKLVVDGIKKVFEIDKKSGKIISLGESVAKSFVEGFKAIKTEFYKVVNDWYTKYVAPWFSEKKWNFSGIVSGLKKAFNTAFESIKGIWNGFAEWINNALNLDFEGFTKQIEVFGKKIDIGIPAFNVQLGKLPTFQTGGFPEDGLFMANHSELVGKFSNGKTAVANNAQITQGIEEAAYRGMMRALSASDIGSRATFEVVGDPNGMFRVMQKQANQYTKSTGKTAFGY